MSYNQDIERAKIVCLKLSQMIRTIGGNLFDKKRPTSIQSSLLQEAEIAVESARKLLDASKD